MVLIPVIISAVLVCADQLAKYAALTRLKPVSTITAVQGLLDFTFVENHGAAFGILAGKRFFFIVITIIICAVMAVLYHRMPKTREYNFVRASFVLIMSGALGNLIDRIVHGYVVDFLEVTFISWPVFNIADIYVVTGTILLAVVVIFFIKEPEKS